MVARKYTHEKLETLVKCMRGEIFNEDGSKMFKADIAKKLDIDPNATFHSWVHKAIKNRLYSKKEYSQWQNTNCSRGYIGKIKANGGGELGEIAASQSCSYARSRVRPMNIIRAAKLGGKKTKRKHKHVRDNLLNGKQYGNSEKYHDGNLFSSKGEALIGALLKEFGLVEEIIRGKNFGIIFDHPTDKRQYKELDFLLNDLNIGIEYHPHPKEKDKTKYSNQNHYNRVRKKGLQRCGFDGQLFVISKPTTYHTYLIFKKILNKKDVEISWQDYLKRFKEISTKIGLSKESKVPFWETE